MPITFNWISLGIPTNTSGGTILIDPTEGNTTAERAGTGTGGLINSSTGQRTFGSAGDPLYNRIVQATMLNRGGAAGTLDQNNNSSNDEFNTTVDGVENTTLTFDATATYNATVTYADGTTATTTVILVQATNGQLYLAPPSTGTDSVLTNKPIVSLTLNSLVSNNFTGLVVDRSQIGWDDGQISGTSGADSIDGSYVEPIGQGSDRVDGGDGTSSAGTSWQDDVIFAHDGNDTVRANLGNDFVSGGDGDDSLFGGAGNDSLQGENGNDWLYGDDGNDQLRGGNGADTLYGGEGNDTVFGNGISGATSDGNDLLYGGNGDDSMAGFDGADTLYGGAGNDYLQGGGGTLALDLGDELYGEDGNDTIFGENGDDSVFGGTGNDSLFGGAGNDEIEGGLGRDTINAGSGNDTIFATAGDTAGDSILGGAGDDFIEGSEGDDTIDGGTEDDEIYGGAGNDDILGGDGADTIFGGAGVDTLYGGLGNDRIEGNENGDLIFGGDGDDTIFAFDGTITGEVETLHGDAGNDILNGDVDANLFYGGTGNDSIFGGNSADTAYGGDDNDSIVASGGNDLLFGEAGDDRLFGGTGNDSLYGGTGNDSMVGGDDRDTFLLQGASFGTDTITGGEGGDDFDVIDTTGVTGNVTVNFTGPEAGNLTASTGGSAIFTQIEGIVTDVGNDTINAALNTGNASYSTGAGNDSIIGGSGNETIDGGAGNDTINGGAGNDSVRGGDGADLILISGANFGADTIIGGEGGTDNDTIDASGVSGNVDILIGSNEAGSLTSSTGGSATFSGIENFITGSGNDSISAQFNTGNVFYTAGAGNDTVAGGSGNETITGDAGDDSLLGNGGNDVIYGGTGNDQLFGGTGNNTLYGGNDADNLVVLTNQAGTTAIFGGEGGNDNDQLTMSGTAPVTINLTGAEAGNFSGGSHSGTFAEIETIITGSGADFINAIADTSGMYFGTSAGADSIYGGSGSDTIWSGADDDIIFGGGGNDFLHGQDGNDTISGGDGNDDIFGGTGNDTLFGGNGADILLGGDGNDFLNGGAGSDTLTGDAGNDVFIADGSPDLIVDFGTGNSGPIDDGDRTNNDFVDLTAFYNDTTLADWNAANPGNPYYNALAWLRADQADGVLQQAGGLRIQNGGAAVAGSALTEDTTGVTCFTRGTMIKTVTGEVAVEDLRKGDHHVLTVDNGYRQIRWIGSRSLSAAELAARPNLRPIRIRADALGPGLPERDLVVSPQHRILVSSRVVRNITGDIAALVAAKHLVGAPGIEIAEDLATVEYWHLMFDDHEIIWSNGAQTESLYTGKEALKSLGPEAVQEIFAIFPELAQRGEEAQPVPARRLLTGREGREITRRKIRKAMAFVDRGLCQPA